MRIHADSDALTEWLGAPAPDNASQLLRAASSLVTDATTTSLYPVDDDGVATDSDVLQALSDATCAHAAQMSRAGIDPLAGEAGLPAEIASKALGPANFSYATAAQVASAKASLLTDLCSQARLILSEAGLLNNDIAGC